jgi:hypothetical protein
VPSCPLRPIGHCPLRAPLGRQGTQWRVAMDVGRELGTTDRGSRRPLSDATPHLGSFEGTQITAEAAGCNECRSW